MDTHDVLAELLAPIAASNPVTPQPAHAELDDNTTEAVHDSQANTDGMTPPPSSQIRSSQRAKTRTPTPTVSHISTPPPTIEAANSTQTLQSSATGTGPDDLAMASAEELRSKVVQLQAALREAKMSAAHYELQYKMLQQESAAAVERMAVEARMAQQEIDVIHGANQARVAATPVQAPPLLPEGVIPVHKDLYQRMNADLTYLQDANRQWEREHAAQERLINKQESEIASLSDKVTLMRERIRENREHLNRTRNGSSGASRMDSTPRSIYSTPHRSHGLEALLQASEMTNPELRQKKGHQRNTHSLSSLPTTPQRMPKPAVAPMYQTPSHRQLPVKVPATAPMPRTHAMKTPGDVYAQQALPLARGPPSEGTVSASDQGDAGQEDDSEAETDILEPETQNEPGDEIRESQASLAASQMLRSSQEQQAKRDSFKGSGMLSGQGGSGGGALKQSKLLGVVRKANVERVVAGADEVPPTKRQRMGEASGGATEAGSIGLGISGVRH
jgi:hypothetical protein